MKKYFIILFLVCAFSVNAQNTHITSGMSANTFMTTVNTNLSKYEEYFGFPFVSTLTLRDPNYISKLNYNMDTLSSLCSVLYTPITIGMSGSSVRTIVNNAFDSYVASSFYQANVARWDNDAKNFLSVTGVQTNDFITRECVNDHVKMLKDSSLWTKFLVLYPLIKDNATQQKWNLKDPQNTDAAHRLTYPYPGLTTYSDKGFAMTGGAWADTKFTSADHLNKNSKTIFSYIQPTSVYTSMVIGSGNYEKVTPTAGNLTTQFNLSTLQWYAPTYYFDMKGFWCATRADKDTAKLFHNTNLLYKIYYPDTARYNPSDPMLLAANVVTTSYAGIGTGLTTPETKKFYNVIEYFESCILRSVNQNFPPSDSASYKAILTVNPAPGETYSFSMAGKSTYGKSVRVYFGDGNMVILPRDNQLHYVINTYQKSATYTITVMYPLGLDQLAWNEGGITMTTDFVNKITDLRVLNTAWDGLKGSADLTNLTKLEWAYVGSAHTGSITNWTSLKTLITYNNCTLSGDITNLTTITNLYIDGKNTITGSTNLLTKLRQLEGMNGYSTVSGSIVSDSIRIVCLAELNNLNWDISNKYKLGYLSVGGTGSATLHGSVTNDTMLFYIGVGGTGSSVTGSLANLKNLALCYQSNYDKPTRFINNPQLCYFEGNPSYTWTSAEINQLLADLWANRDVFRRPVDAYGNYWPNIGGIGGIRYINLLGSQSTGAPTGQGLIDLQNLRNYITPPNYYNTTWTILTR